MKALFTRVAVLAVPVTVLAFALAPACSSRAKTAGDEKETEIGLRRDNEIKHEPCDPKGHTEKTYRADDNLSPARAYVTHVYDGGHEICAFADLNGDGRIDVYTYFDNAGQIRRREAAYGVNEQIDEIAIYKAGELEVVMRETNFDGKLDTWDFYEGGRLARRERDKTGDGRIDEWWTFEPGSSMATIVQADPQTGKPDPTQALKIDVGFNPAGGRLAGASAAKGDAGPGKTADGGVTSGDAATGEGGAASPTTTQAPAAPMATGADASSADAAVAPRRRAKGDAK